MTKYRLRGNPFERSGKGLQPRRAIVLSVEGSVSEQQYLRGLSEAIAKEQVNLPLCVVEPLTKKDTNSDPSSVIDLLEECLSYTGSDVVQRLPAWFRRKYKDEVIRRYLNQELKGNVLKEFNSDLEAVGMDLHYAHFLSQFDPTTDIFGIMIDHDHRTDLKTHLDYCAKSGYNVFLSNPCFEFWLLLHLVDVKNDYCVDELRENPRVSSKHRYITEQVSKLTHSSKRVDFRKYLPNLDYAIEQAQEFETNIYGLITNLGTNVHLLFEIIKGTRNSIWEEYQGRVSNEEQDGL